MLMSAHANDISSINNQPLIPANEIFTTIFTEPLIGTNAELVFDFSAGNGDLPNAVTITGFMTDGIQSPINATVKGDVTGNLASTITLNNTDKSNEFIQPITLGNSIGFTFNPTQNIDPLATLPDTFAVYLLDANGNTLFTTTDSTGANSLLSFTIGPVYSNLNVSSATANISNPVLWGIAEPSNILLATPVPGAFWLFATACIGFCFKHSRHKRWQAVVE
jgi:hypothetical protein